MFKRLFKGIFTALGMVVGYELFSLFNYYVSEEAKKNPEYMELSKMEAFWMGILFAIIFGVIFYKMTSVLSRTGNKMATNISKDLQGVSANDLLAGVLGLTMGLIVAFLLTKIYQDIVPAAIYVALTICIYISLGFLGAVVGSKKGSELITRSIAPKVNVSQKQQQEENAYAYNAKDRKKTQVPKILDTSVIIDGRILEIIKTGFMEGPIVIPEFVLVELRHIADSSDALKRTRGRRGLDILNKIQEEYGIEIYNSDSEKSLKEIPEVDVKLIKLAQIMKGKVVTNDFNLNKVAVIKEVPVLNINELANALKPMVIPGESMTVTLIKQGKDQNQAVAYLDDGTMIVVENGRKQIGNTVDILVTSVLQTAAGRMIFGKVTK
ncbi:MAG: TRAM domain-containing protein [Firmicutes bacterium]|nr:TRAM domain-containing protein [Bacillota bacterium]